MSISFHNASVGSYLQVLEGVAGVLDKGASHATETGLDLKEVVMTQLRDDMMPLHFQVVSVAHHSRGVGESAAILPASIPTLSSRSVREAGSSTRPPLITRS